MWNLGIGIRVAQERSLTGGNVGDKPWLPKGILGKGLAWGGTSSWMVCRASNR